jgi:DNA-binding FadR family transcriptional regulator
VTALQGLRDRVHIFRLQQPLTDSQMERVIDEHAALIDAIEAGHQSRAVDQIRSHLEATKARIESAQANEVERERSLAEAGGTI